MLGSQLMDHDERGGEEREWAHLMESCRCFEAAFRLASLLSDWVSKPMTDVTIGSKLYPTGNFHVDILGKWESDTGKDGKWDLLANGRVPMDQPGMRYL